MDVVLVIVCVVAVGLVLAASLWAGGHPKKRRSEQDTGSDPVHDAVMMSPLMHGGSADEPRHDEGHRSHGTDASWDDAPAADVGGNDSGSVDSGGGDSGSGDGGGSGD